MSRAVQNSHQFTELMHYELIEHNRQHAEPLLLQKRISLSINLNALYYSGDPGEEKAQSGGTGLLRSP